MMIQVMRRCSNLLLSKFRNVDIFFLEKYLSKVVFMRYS